MIYMVKNIIMDVYMYLIDCLLIILLNPNI